MSTHKELKQLAEKMAKCLGGSVKSTSWSIKLYARSGKQVKEWCRYGKEWREFPVSGKDAQ